MSDLANKSSKRAQEAHRDYEKRKTFKSVYIEPINLLDNGIKRYEDHRGNATMLIFNQINFAKNYQKKLEGGEIDGPNLKSTFEKFGFNVDVYVDLTKDDIFKTLKEVKLPTDLKCIAIVVLSHGGAGEICAYDKDYYEADILKCFKTKENLKGVPKLFIFDLCRKNTPIDLLLPDEDMIVLHSTYFDEVASINAKLGSWFTQTLCKRLNLMKRENLLLDEMTFVSRDMSVKHHGLQMPVVSYNMKKHFYLNPCDNNTI